MNNTSKGGTLELDQVPAGKPLGTGSARTPRESVGDRPGDTDPQSAPVGTDLSKTGLLGERVRTPVLRRVLSEEVYVRTPKTPVSILSTVECTP